MGYTGGTSENPTYYNLDGHTEAIQIDYDPAMISYGDLLNHFWKSHDPTSHSWSSQYKKAIFYHDEEQRKSAEESRGHIGTIVKGRVKTEILPYREFYLAEDYHQKHSLRGYPELMDEFNSQYPTLEELISSTAAARVNGYLGGYGTCERLQSDLHGFGLSETAVKRLVEKVCGDNVSMSCPTKQCL